MKRGAIVAAAVLLVIAACGDDDPAAGPRTFDPSKYRKDCTADADCIEVGVITDCSACCGAAAVRRDSTAEADYTAVGNTCQPMALCPKLCAENVVSCAGGECTLTPKPEPDP